MDANPPCEMFDPAPRLAGSATEQRRAARLPCGKPGRLAYGGLQPGMLGCDVVDMSAQGARVQTYARLGDVPDFFTLELDGNYYRARRIWGCAREMGLEFLPDDDRLAGVRG